MTPTKISWTEATWNPVTGCTKVSPGCAHCYIENTPPMRMAGRRFVDGKIPVTLHPDRLEIPLHWRKPRRVFVASMGDLFHEDVPDEFIEKVWATMMRASDHTFQVLTKRPGRMRAFVIHHEVDAARRAYWASGGDQRAVMSEAMKPPLPNIWLGVSVENQDYDWRIGELMKTPAAVRFVSCEPLLGPLDLTPWLPKHDVVSERLGECRGCASYRELDWVIVGGESGGPPERRLVERCVCRGKKEGHEGTWQVCGRDSQGHPVFGGWHPKPEALEWVRSLRDQCAAADVSFFFKQWGPKAGQGTLVDDREWREMPR